MRYRYIESPIGDLLIAGEGDELHYIGFPEGKGRVTPDENWTHVPDDFSEVKEQLDEYFTGTRQEFNLKLKPQGTEFQLAVLDALLSIPYGATTSYGELARKIGRPKAVRAVGAANGRNPLPIVIPCHRVIGSDGGLTGFGGGLPAKVFLLELESGGFRLD